MMKQLFQENKNAFLLLLGLLFVLLFAVYFFLYRPVATELKETEQQEQFLNEEIAVLETKINTISDGETDSEEERERTVLETKIPSLPELDTFLLTLNEIGDRSNSHIEMMSFGYQGELPDRPDTVEEEQPEPEPESEAEGEEANSTLELAELPGGLRPITVTLDVQSPDYEHFQLLLTEMENQERIMIVPSLSFDKPAENELLFSEDPDEIIDVTIEVMTFYFER